MGHRTSLYIQEASREQAGDALCVDETNNRYALEWFAWVPQAVMDGHLQQLRRITPMLRADSDTEGSEDDTAIKQRLASSSGLWDQTLIHVPYLEALACFKASIFRVLKVHPELAPALRDLFVELQKHAKPLSQPMLVIDCVQMANFSDLTQYAQELRELHLFWQLQTPFSRVSHASPLNHPRDGLHGATNLAHSTQFQDLHRQIAALEIKAYGQPVRKTMRWRHRYETVFQWVLSIFGAAIFFAVYGLTQSAWWGIAASLLAGVGATLLIYRRPKPPIVLDEQALRDMDSLRQVAKSMQQAQRNTSGDSSFDVDEWTLHQPYMKAENALADWDDEAVTLKLLTTEERKVFPWADIDGFSYDADDGASDAALVGVISLTDAADESGKYEDDHPLWFHFDARMDAHLMMLVLRLLHKVWWAAR